MLEGNSHLAELVYYWTCETTAADAWKLWTNDIYVRVKNGTYSASIFLFDNDRDLNFHPDKIVSSFATLKLVPDVIVLGGFNHVDGSAWGLDRIGRRAVYEKAFPSAHYVVPKDEFLGYECTAEFNNCIVIANEMHHQCLPGPIARVAEQLVHNISRAFQHDVFA